MNQKQINYFDRLVKSTENFSGIMIHELRTPFNGISGVHQLLEDKLSDSEAQSANKTNISIAQKLPEIFSGIIRKAETESPGNVQDTFLDLICRCRKYFKKQIETLLENTSYLKKHMPDDITTLSMAETCIEKITSIMNTILLYNDIRNGDLKLVPGQVDIRNLLNELTNNMQNQAAEKNLQMNISIENDVPEVLIGDAVRIEQILSNIINNAIEFTQKGRIDVLVTTEKNANNNPELRIAITDTGIGIAPTDLKMVFLPFTQVVTWQHHSRGQGLGLPIARGLAELMGGSIELMSQFGRETTVTVAIPLQIPASR
ncbi:MAG: ATP-binding protein [Candidatus Margulisiibacteriota bacterium]